jgi:hypothetical protein
MSTSESKLYLAYGSNLNIGQMTYRCPTAQVVGYGVLNNYRLLFRGGYGHAVATIEPFAGGIVPVLAWEITAEDEAALDNYEGFPTFYRKENFRIQLDDQIHTAMIYIMNIKNLDGSVRPLGRPGRDYFCTIMQAYHWLATDMKRDVFDVDILNEALYHSTGQFLFDNEN